jgi:hypothetical protein
MVPATADLARGGRCTFMVRLASAVPMATPVALEVSPSSAGTVPAQVIVPANVTSAWFEFVHGQSDAPATVRASLAAAAKDSVVRVVEPSPSCLADAYEPNETAVTARSLGQMPATQGSAPPAAAGVSATLCPGDVDWYAVNVHLPTASPIFGGGLQPATVHMRVDWSGQARLTLQVWRGDVLLASVQEGDGQIALSNLMLSTSSYLRFAVSGSSVDPAGALYQVQVRRD